MVKCRLVQDTKFFEVTLDGCEVKTSYGRIGQTTPQTDFNKYPSAAEAREAYSSLVASKEKKGFTKDEEEKKPAKRAATKEAEPAKKKSKVPDPVFKDVIFVTSDNLSKSAAAIEKLIEDNGGSVGTVLSKMTSYFLMSDDDFKSAAYATKLSKAKLNKTPVLHEDFLFDSVKNGKLQDEDDYDLHTMHAPPKKKAKKEESDDDDPADNSRGAHTIFCLFPKLRRHLF